MSDDPLPQPATITDDMLVKMDVPYCPGLKSDPSTRQALDLYAPRHGADLPVIAYIHGGGWRYWDRKGVDQKPATFTRLGYIFISIGYRLVPEVRYREQCSDVAHGLRWIREHIREFGGHPNRLHLMGFSAGAPMAALTIADPQYLTSAGVPISAIRSMTGIDGDCYDVARQIEMVDTRTREYHHSVWGDDPNGWADPSPITHLRPGHSYPPFLLMHLQNRPDATWQAEAFARRYREVGGEVQVLPVDTTHLTLNRNIGRPDDAATVTLLSFLSRHDAPPKQS